MAIYDHKYGDLLYLRVYRSWGGKEYQEYVRIKRSRAAAYREAEDIDRRFESAQRRYVLALAQTPEYHMHSEGTIRGLRRVRVVRKGRTPVEVFELRINVPWQARVKRTTISIAVHGEEAAFKQAIEKICSWYDLDEDGPVYRSLLAAFPSYRSARPSVADQAIQIAKGEIVSLAGGLVKGLRRIARSAP